MAAKSSESGSKAAESALTFGKAIRVWFKRNGWPGIAAEGWARASGSKTGPWASQISNLMNGKLDPKPPLFVALADFNMAVTTRDFACVKDQRVLHQLKDSQSFCHDDGEPFDAGDFFRLFVGHIEVPEEFQSSGPVSDQEAAQWTADCKAAFDAHMLSEMQTRKESWAALTSCLGTWKPQQVKLLQKVLIGEHQWTGAEATELRDDHGPEPAMQALKLLPQS